MTRSGSARPTRFLKRSAATTSPARGSGSSSMPKPTAPCPRFSTSTAAALPWRRPRADRPLRRGHARRQDHGRRQAAPHRRQKELPRRNTEASNSRRAGRIPKICASSFSPPHSSFLPLPRTTPSQMATLNDAIRAVDLSALDSGALPKAARRRKPNSMPACARRIRSSKRSSRCCRPRPSTSPATRTSTPRGSGRGPKQSTWSKRTFGTALQLMYEYPQYTYTQSAAQYNEWMAQKYPDLNAEIAQRIKEGRWEIVGGMWVEPDLTCPTANRLSANCWLASAGTSRRTASMCASAGTPILSATHGNCRKSTRSPASTTSSPRR